MPSGHVIVTQTDFDKPVEEKYSILEYDPTTEEEVEYVQDSEHDDMLHPGFSSYLEEPRKYIHTLTKVDSDDAETYIWDIENDEFTDVTFIQDIKEEVGEDELKDYPHFYLNEDASMAYATVMDTGVFAYDVEKKETETLLETDSLVSIDT